MLTKTSEYALRAVVALASRPGDSLLSPYLAEITGVPPAYLSKVLRTLVREELVRSQRGQGGGFSLALPAEKISVLDVIEAVDPIRRIERCPLGLPGHSGELCPLHRSLDEMIATVRRRFADTPVAELVAAGDGESPLCPAPDGR